MSNEIAGILLLAIVAFWRELFGLLKFLFSKRERNAEIMVQEATTFEKLMSQNLETQQQLMTTTSTFTQFVMDTRKRNDERETQHNIQIKALEKSLIDSQEENKNYYEKVNTLSEMVQKLAIENEGKDRTIDSLNRRITTLEESEKQAHHLVIQKDYKITELEKRLRELEPLEKRVKELEAEIQRLKEQQKPQQIEATVTIAEAPTDGQPASPLVQPQGESSDPTPAQDSGVVS